MQQQQQVDPFRAQLMNSFHTLIANESEEVVGKVALAVMRLDDRECENLLTMAEVVRRAALLQLARGQQAGAGAGAAEPDFNQLLADLTDIKAQLEPYSRAVQPVQSWYTRPLAGPAKKVQ